MVATFVAEGIQLGTLYVLSRRQGFRVSPSHTEPLRNALSHARAGILISLLCLFAQTGLMGITLSRWLLSTVDQGIFTVAYRVSQLILFPLIGASQLIIPLSSRLHAPSEIALVRREIRNLLWSTNGCNDFSNIAWAVDNSRCDTVVIFDTTIYNLRWDT